MRARQAGGIKRSRRAIVLPAETPDCDINNATDISTLLNATINQLRRGQLDPKIATAIGYLANIQLNAFKQGALEQRMTELEKLTGILAAPLGKTVQGETGTPDSSSRSQNRDES